MTFFIFDIYVDTCKKLLWKYEIGWEKHIFRSLLFLSYLFILKQKISVKYNLN